MTTLARYAQSICTVYPAFDIGTMQLHTADGQFNDIVIVNHELIFRFPRSAHVAASYTAHRMLLSALAPHLPLPIPTPIYWSPAGSAWQETFMGYRRIPGEPLYQAALDAIHNPADRQALAQQLATFLQRMHQLPYADLLANMPVHDTWADWSDLYQGIQQQLFRFMRLDAQQWVKAHFEAFLAQPDPMRFIPALRHGDFGGSNILYDPVSCRISGIIDFDSSGLGDPATDIAALLSYGPEFFALCLKYYPDMQGMLARADFYQGTFALQEAYYGLRDGNQEAFEDGIAQYR